MRVELRQIQNLQSVSRVRIRKIQPIERICSRFHKKSDVLISGIYFTDIERLSFRPHYTPIGIKAHNVRLPPLSVFFSNMPNETIIIRSIDSFPLWRWHI